MRTRPLPVLAALLVLGACASGAPSSGPTSTPQTVAPQITNRSEVVEALEREYPPLLREAGIGGTATVWVFIDENGRVQETRIQESSGDPQLDEAALRVAEIMRFSPALNDGERVPVWVAFPITFAVRSKIL